MVNKIKKKIAIRVESRQNFGGGHFSRCVNLYNSFNNCELFFFTNGLSSLQVKKKKGYKLNSRVFSKKIFDTECFDICILDGYYFDKEELHLWRKHCNYFVIFDDLSKKINYADLVISFGETNKKNKSNISNIKYYPVENSFFEISKKYKVKKKVKNILISFGLIDSLLLTNKIIEILSKQTQTFKSINFIIIISSSFKGKKRLNKQLSKSDLNYQLVEDTCDMQKFLEISDLVIGSAGVSLIERVASSIPSLTIMTSTNQINQLRFIKKNSATEILKKSMLEVNFIKYIRKFLLDYKYRKRMHEQTKGLLLENGSKLLCKKILKYYDEFCYLKSKNEDWK